MFDSNKEYNKKRCAECKYFNDKKGICKKKNSESIIREVIEYENLEDTENYMCKEQKMCCSKCQYLCKNNGDVYCDFGRFGIGKAKRQEIEWKKIEDAKSSACDDFCLQNPLNIIVKSSKHCANCLYYYENKGCMKDDGKNFKKIKWTKIEDAALSGCKSFEKSFESSRTVSTLTIDVHNCYNCVNFNTEMGCIVGKKPKSICKKIEKPAYHVCKTYSPSWLRNQDYKNSCATCKFFLQGKGCVNIGRKGLKDLKRLS